MSNYKWALLIVKEDVGKSKWATKTNCHTSTRIMKVCAEAEWANPNIPVKFVRHQIYESYCVDC